MTEERATEFLHHLLAGGLPSRLSVVGLSKNAGKTVTLNHIIRAAAGRQIPLGLVSTGRDGEQQDAITELPKPRIWAPAGAWIATARGALAGSTAQIAALQELPISTPFGPVIIGRVEAEGQVLLIGPGSARKISEALGGLEAMGAELCLVDGSFDRIAAAAPDVTGRVVLAAGAAYSASMTETVSQVKHLLELFDLPPIPPHLAGVLEQVRSPVSIVTQDGAISEVPLLSALGDPEPIAVAAGEQEANRPLIVLSGALGDRLLMALIKRRLAGVGIVVHNSTRILADRNTWRRWRRQGGQAYVRRPIQLVAVTANPHSPVGRDYDAHAFLAQIRTIAGRPVFDLEAGL